MWSRIIQNHEDRRVLVFRFDSFEIFYRISGDNISQIVAEFEKHFQSYFLETSIL